MAFCPNKGELEIYNKISSSVSFVFSVVKRAYCIFSRHPTGFRIDPVLPDIKL